MPTLLQIHSSPLPTSVSRELTAEFARAWSAAHPGGHVITRDLNAAPPPPIDAEWIGSAYTAPSDRTAAQDQAIALSEELIGELERAGEVVIGVPMHNFGVPAVLKLWVDQVARRGRTFEYGAGGPRGLLGGKKVTVIVATGGVYSAGSPVASWNHAEPYLRTVFHFLGITDIEFIAAEGTSKLASPTVDRSVFLRPAIEQVRAAAA